SLATGPARVVTDHRRASPSHAGVGSVSEHLVLPAAPTARSEPGRRRRSTVGTRPHSPRTP
ncbi:MAG: hypothetical protein ACK5F7_10055, partial [Planctomycetaceae bacterium]